MNCISFDSHVHVTKRSQIRMAPKYGALPKDVMPSGSRLIGAQSFSARTFVSQCLRNVIYI
jgi:hypothetical protein